MYDLAGFQNYPAIFSIFGGGLILIWIAINFGLFYSILFHCTVNSIGMLSLLISYEMNLDEVKTVETTDFIMNYEPKSFLEKSNNSNIKTDMNTFLEAENSSILDINSFLCPNISLDEVYFGSFDVTIKRKNGKKKLDCQSFKELLDKSKINEE